MSFYARYAGIFGGGGGGGGTTTFIQEQPTGATDGVNVTFTLSQAPTANENLILWQNGIVQYQGIGLDYTISGVTITMSVAPDSTQSLWAFFS